MLLFMHTDCYSEAYVAEHQPNHPDRCTVSTTHITPTISQASNRHGGLCGLVVTFGAAKSRFVPAARIRRRTSQKHPQETRVSPPWRLPLAHRCSAVSHIRGGTSRWHARARATDM